MKRILVLCLVVLMIAGCAKEEKTVKRAVFAWEGVEEADEQLLENYQIDTIFMDINHYSAVPGYNIYLLAGDPSWGLEDMEKVVEEAKEKKQGVSYILWSNDTSGVVGAIEGIELIKSIPNLEIIFDVKEGVKYRSNQYLVTFVFSTDTIDEMIDMISFINRNVKIFDDSGKNICIYYNDFETIKRIYNQQ